MLYHSPKAVLRNWSDVLLTYAQGLLALKAQSLSDDEGPRHHDRGAVHDDEFRAQNLAEGVRSGQYEFCEARKRWWRGRGGVWDTAIGSVSPGMASRRRWRQGGGAMHGNYMMVGPR